MKRNLRAQHHRHKVHVSGRECTTEKACFKLTDGPKHQVPPELAGMVITTHLGAQVGEATLVLLLTTSAKSSVL